MTTNSFIPYRVSEFSDWTFPVSGDNGKTVRWNHLLQKYEHIAFEASGQAVAEVAAHVALVNPHTQYLLSSAYTAGDVLSKVLTVDGPGSGLNADFLDGLSSVDFESSGSSSAAILAHVALGNPHNQYTLASSISAFGATLVDDADQTAARGTLGLVIGTNVQAQNTNLAALAGLTGAADKAPYFTGSGALAMTDFTAFGRSLAASASADAGRTTLGLGTMATQASTAYLLASGYTAADVLSKLLSVDGSGSGLDADLLDGLSSAAFETVGVAAGLITAHVGLPNPHTQYTVVSNTRAIILASSPTVRTVALATDTLEMFAWDGLAWYVAPLELIVQPNAVDMGLLPPMVQNDRAGFNATSITDKTINNSAIGVNTNTTEGSIRVSSGALQIYLLGVWNDVVTGFRFREDSVSGQYELEHRPIGFTSWIEVMSGNSDALGLNGLPLTQGYVTSIGPYPAHAQIVGREITS